MQSNVAESMHLLSLSLLIVRLAVVHCSCTVPGITPEATTVLQPGVSVILMQLSSHTDNACITVRLPVSAAVQPCSTSCCCPCVLQPCL
jgi:hypothetical protein